MPALRISLAVTGAVAVLLILGGSTPPQPAALLPDEVCLVAPPTPYDPKAGVALHAPRAVPPDARCPVCGMFPARAREWAAQIVFDNGDTQFFDSPLSLFIYLQDVGRYTRGRTTGDIAARYVTDVETGQWIDARDAWYVHGSSARGPMRAGNFPAFGSPEAAARFAQVRGGQVLRSADVTPALIDSLDGSSRHLH